MTKSHIKALLTDRQFAASMKTRPEVSLCRASDGILFCSVSTFNFYSPGTDYGLGRAFGIEKTVIIENKFGFFCIEIPDKKGMDKMFSLFISLFFIPKSFKTIVTGKFAILSPPCRVCEESDPPII